MTMILKYKDGFHTHIHRIIINKKTMYQNSVQQEYEMALKIRKYMEECNGKDSWKPYVGSQLEADLVRFVLKEKAGD